VEPDSPPCNIMVNIVTGFSDKPEETSHNKLHVSHLKQYTALKIYHEKGTHPLYRNHESYIKQEKSFNIA
jgi:hypothetical protein